VKVCSLYGAGFYYIPGTDTCVKWGGYVRYEAYHNEATGAYPTTTNTGFFSRTANVWSQHARFRLTSDVRSQTEYGTLRSYFSAGFNWHNTATNPDTQAGAVAFERAFIQFAGFTFGRTESFFAFYNGAAYGLVPTQYDASTGPAGINVAAYTAQFGNGVSATISLEDSQQRSAPVVDANQTAQFGIAASTYTAGTNDLSGNKTPDIVGNIRVDQAWGSAQIMGALHQIGGNYWNTANGCATANTTLCGHPDDKWGWAIGAGMTLKMPWDQRDTLSFQVAYAEGATRYVANGSGNHFLHKNGGIAVGQFTDAVFGNPVAGYDGSLQLTEAWGGTVAFEHYWTPSLRTSVIAAYLDVSYNGTVKNFLVGCTAPLVRGSDACNPDWSAWRIGSRTMWNPVANLDVGVEVFYSKINTAYAGNTITNPGQGLGGTYTVADESVWSAAFRVQRSFWP
jgi:hypothetical protein